MTFLFNPVPWSLFVEMRFSDGRLPAQRRRRDSILPPNLHPRRPSALTRTEDSQRRRTVRVCRNGSGCRTGRGSLRIEGRPVKHVQRGQIILLSAERLPVFEIAKRVSI